MIGPRSLVGQVAIAVVASTAVAAPSERDDSERLAHAIPVVLGGALYVISEAPLKDAITPQHCRWCEPNAFDASVRSALRWDDVHLAAKLSNWTGYVGSPLLATGGLLWSSDPDGRRWLDDTIPVLQAAVAVGLLNQTVKVIVGRQRPFSYYGTTPTRARNDFHTSFFSGHTALGFAMVTSSATVAHLRDYRSETALWIGGAVLATATSYLRIAADAHYATDVLVGAVVGSGIGIAIPLLLHRDVLTDEAAVPRTRPVLLSIGGAF